jgi:tetratricopeptide (TPR) repeat protein
MGVICRATDILLGREIAIKVLHERFAPDAGVAQRFADEARITAQLQHPAIPPVHDLGILPDGRPFLAMKLIKGSTLEYLLATRPDATTDRDRYLLVFQQICQALAYAHAHDVIHRDLKPANVMVGPFGEVQVMDWGLAKVLGARADDREDPEATRAGTAVLSLRDSDGSFTQAGSVLGTPAFMAPEQAAGAVGKVDQRSDVFGLGSILAVILTGQPPFAGGSAETSRVRAAQGDVAECLARLDACGAEAGLVSLCKRCLQPKAAERPAHAGEVAAAVAKLLQAAEERVRTSELKTVRAVEGRKRRRVQGALAAAVGVLLVGGLAFGWWYSGQRRLTREGEIHKAVAELTKHAQNALQLEDVDGALVLFIQALQLEPTNPRVRLGLGSALWQAGDLDHAVEEYREAVRMDPRNVVARTWLGNALRCKGDVGGARTQYQEAVRLFPNYWGVHTELGDCLERAGDLDGAIQQFGEAVQLNPNNDGTARLLARARRLRELLPRMADVLAGKQKPRNPKEGCEFAYFLSRPFQSYYAAATRLSKGAFAADPNLAEDLRAGHRYNAACYAALAGCGRGKDTPQHDDLARASLRRQALNWLQADLELLRREASSADANQCRHAATTLASWLNDWDLAGVRPRTQQITMPAEELAAWNALWTDLKATRLLAQKGLQ